MSTLFTVLAVIALAIAILVLLAPKAFAWLIPARHSRNKAVALYLLAAMVLGFAARLSAGPLEEAAEAGVNATANATALNATALNATEPQKQIQSENSAVTGASEASKPRAAGNATTQGQEKDKPFMDQAQDSITRAANATREFGRNVADQAGEIGSELVEGASEAGKNLWEGTKQTTDELLNNN